MPTLMTDKELEVLLRQSKNQTAELRRIRMRMQRQSFRAQQSGNAPTELDADAVEDWDAVTREALGEG